MKFDYTSMGFYTFDALCHPVTDLPKGGDTHFVENFTLAVSGAAGSAAIVAAKHGLKVQAVGGVGDDLMGEWVLRRLGHFEVDIELMQICPEFTTSSSIVTTRPNGARPAFHKRGATAGFFIEDEQIDRLLDTNVLHLGGVGLTDAMDTGRNAEIFAEAKKRDCITTLDVFASTPDDLNLIKPLLKFTDYFMPSEEEAMALSGLSNFDDIAKFLLDFGVSVLILTLGKDGLICWDQSGNKLNVPAYDVNVVCTCGCGDCFNAGFATGLCLNRSIEDCLRIGQATSAQNAMGLGSQATVKDLESTFEFMKNTPLKMIKK